MDEAGGPASRFIAALLGGLCCLVTQVQVSFCSRKAAFPSGQSGQPAGSVEWG